MGVEVRQKNRNVRYMYKYSAIIPISGTYTHSFQAVYVRCAVEV